MGGGLASDKSQPGFSSCGEQGSRKKMQLEVRSLPAWLLSLNEQAAKSSAKKRGEGCVERMTDQKFSKSSCNGL